MNNNFNNESQVNFSAPTPTHPLSKISKILGIVGAIIALCSGPVVSIAAVVLACISKSKVGYFQPEAQTGKSLGILGIVLGVVGLILSFVLGVILGLLEAGLF